MFAVDLVAVELSSFPRAFEPHQRSRIFFNFKKNIVKGHCATEFHHSTQKYLKKTVIIYFHFTAMFFCYISSVFVSFIQVNKLFILAKTCKHKKSLPGNLAPERTERMEEAYLKSCMWKLLGHQISFHHVIV